MTTKAWLALAFVCGLILFAMSIEFDLGDDTVGTAEEKGSRVILSVLGIIFGLLLMTVGVVGLILEFVFGG